MDCHVLLSWIVLDRHGLSWTIMDYHRLDLAFIDRVDYND